MKKFPAILAGAAVLVASSAAFAADVPVRAPIYTKAPPAISLWDGVYVGIHGGYGWGDSNVRIGAVTGESSPSGGFGGLQFGYNYQIAPRWVLGYEIDASLGDVSDTAPPFAASNVNADIFGTARVRVGYTYGQWLVYATGGMAWARTEFTVGGVLDSDRPLIGWAAGAGLEYALSRNLSAKLEYLYADFDNATRVVGGVAVSNDLTMSMVRLGLNYRFSNAPVAEVAAFPVKAPVRVAAGWTGAYIGAHGGYGFGSFDASVAGIATSLEPAGGFGGFQSGYNWQLSRNWIIGIEADSSFGSISETIGATTIDIDAMGTVRGRLGYAMDRLMVYGTGGLAWAHVNSTINGPVVSNHYLLGWTLGAGVEWALSQSWTAKLEYAYADFTQGETLGAAGYSDSLDVHTIKVGLNYRASLFGLLLNR